MINNSKSVAFDLDGTIYYGNKIIEGVLEVVNFLKKRQIKVFYFTNNSVKCRSQIYKKLYNMGLELSIDEIYSSAYAAAVYLKENKINDVYCIGSDGLIEELKSNNINLTKEEKDVKAIIVGLDVDFTYSKISKALNILQKGCRFIICNRDRSYPAGNSTLMPGAGSIVSAIEYASGKRADYMIGKPNTYMLELLAKDHNLINNEILVVGDSYESDIEMARRYNCMSVLVCKESKAKVKDMITISNIKGLEDIFNI